MSTILSISELQVKQGKVEVQGIIKEKEPTREFSKFGKVGRVCNAVLEDDTGEIKLTLWNEQTEEVNAGDTIKIENGWVGEYQGEKQLTTGKFGKLEIVKKGEGIPNSTNSSSSASTQKTQIYKPGLRSSVQSSDSKSTGSKEKPKQYEDEVQDYNNDSDTYEESTDDSKPYTDEEFIE